MLHAPQSRERLGLSRCDVEPLPEEDGIMGIKVMRRGFVLNDIETEGARFLTKARAGKFPIETDELIHVLRLDSDVH